MGHTPGSMAAAPPKIDTEFPFTLDLRMSDDRRPP
jgi:hypothetical protein